MSRPRTAPTLLIGLALALSACDGPALGPRKPATAVETPSPVLPPSLAITGASVDVDGRVVVDFTLRRGEVPVAAADAAALRPTFTLAALDTDPVSGLRAWRSLLLTGSQVIPSNPVGGPGTPPEHVLDGLKAPGSATGTPEDLGGGAYRLTLPAPLPAGHDPALTLRVGAWLNGTTGTSDTSTTHDFVPAGGAPEARELVVDADCQRCHALVLAHGRRTGVRLCTTCHTTQCADPDTVDPAAPASATPGASPNPLDFGRMVHRIHRGKALPTLYQASSTDPPPALGSAASPPLPFLATRNTPVTGRRYAIVGHQSREFVFGEVRSLQTPLAASPRVVAGGVTFPRDYRDCDSCHGRAAQKAEIHTAISRRTCSGCHPDAWFQAGAAGDAFHMPHTGGVQADDTGCAGCHTAGGATPWVDTAVVHQPVVGGPRSSPITATIEAVTNLLPGQKPTIVFTLSDRNGSLSPLNPATATPPLSPANDTRSPASPVPRKVTRLAFVLAGPTAPDYLTSNVAISEQVTDEVVADADGRFTYACKTATVPEGATGTWSVGLEARRQLTGTTAAFYRATFYDTAARTFSWPYTGEALTESASNVVLHVDVAAGAQGQGTPTPRRAVVELARCNACHGNLTLHGGNRNTIESCLLCHTADATDWAQRPRDASGNTALGLTFDGVEERSIHLKTMIHRIHTGAAAGTAQLDFEPFVIHGYRGTPYFFDEGVFPGDLANCRLCHLGETFALESIPAGAPPTVANESASIQHAAKAAHGSSEPKVPPMTAACTSCHDTGTARFHAAKYVANGVEACVSCHGASAALSVYGLHGVARPATP